jgi:hypothetical protein
MESAFLDQLNHSLDELFVRVEAGCARAGDDPFTGIEAALEEVLAWVAERPEAAWICTVEAPRTMPGGFPRQQEAITDLAAMLRQRTPSHVPRPELLEECLVGGVCSVVGHLILSGEADRAPGLAPDLSALLLAPYINSRPP